MVPPNSFSHHPFRHKPTHKKKTVVMFWMCVFVRYNYFWNLLTVSRVHQLNSLCLKREISQRREGREIRFSFFAAAAATEPSGIHKYLREWRVCVSEFHASVTVVKLNLIMFQLICTQNIQSISTDNCGVAAAVLYCCVYFHFLFYFVFIFSLLWRISFLHCKHAHIHLRTHTHIRSSRHLRWQAILECTNLGSLWLS